MPADTQPQARAWGAVMTEDGPVCEVRDLTSAELHDLWDRTDFRIWCVSAIGGAFAREGHSRGPACVPGAPCKKCRETALTWWWEHGRRTKARIFKAATAHAREQDGRSWRASDFGEERVTLAEAMADARERGWPLVKEIDGHGKTLSWTEVPNGK